jgi:hypothetical protein
LLVPFIVTLGAARLFRKTITGKEVALQLFVISGLIVSLYYMARGYSVQDYEHLHGRVLRTTFGAQDCCHCTDTCGQTDKDGRCVREEKNCNHPNDWYWALETTIGKMNLASCEPDGSLVPPAWKKAQVGEAAATYNRYDNYLKARPEAVIPPGVPEALLARVPQYPGLHDGYKFFPVVSSDTPIPSDWQQALRDINADLGAKHQVEIAVLLTAERDPAFADAVAARWLYGPKNSVTFVLGLDGKAIRWARLVTISKVPELDAAARATLPGKAVSDDIPGIIRQLVQSKFKRTPMADFEYLMSYARPSTGWLIFLYILGAVLSIGISVLMHRVEVFKAVPPNPFRRGSLG